MNCMQFENIDETPIYLNMPASSTLQVIGSG